MTIKVQNIIGLDSNTLKWGKYKFIPETGELILKKRTRKCRGSSLKA